MQPQFTTADSASKRLYLRNANNHIHWYPNFQFNEWPFSKSWMQKFRSCQPTIYSSIQSFWCSFIRCCCGFMVYQHNIQAMLSYQMLIGGSPKSKTFLFMISTFFYYCSDPNNDLIFFLCLQHRCIPIQLLIWRLG
jgi:hypothetical protein